MNRVDVDRLINSFDSPERANWQKPNEVISLFGELEGKKIMDLGAGSGYFTFRLANHGAYVISADVNKEFQEKLKEKFEKDEFRHLKNRIEVRKVPYDKPGLKKEEVDGILLVNTYHHIDDRTEYMKKVLSGLKSGAKLIIVDFKVSSPYGPPRSHKLDLLTAVSELIPVGFSSIHLDMKMLDRQYVIICQK
jgi:SAM-dependent methyltransferase